MKTIIIITVEKEDHADAINENLAELERDGTLDFAFNIEIKKDGQLRYKKTYASEEDENDLYGTEEYVRISDINKEIARNWKKEKK